MHKLFSLSVAVLFFSFVLAGCSGGESDTNTEQNEMNGQQATSQNDEGTRTIDVIGIDKLKFVVAEQSEGVETGEEITYKGNTYYVLEGFTAQAGQKVTVNLKTISDLPATAMAHNWLLLAPDADPAAFAQASQSAKEHDYVAPDMEDKWIADTGLVGGGESKSVTFTAPEEAGDYEYICTFPAHFTAGMRGTMTVE